MPLDCVVQIPHVFNRSTVESKLFVAQDGIKVPCSPLFLAEPELRSAAPCCAKTVKICKKFEVSALISAICDGSGSVLRQLWHLGFCRTSLYQCFASCVSVFFAGG